jgi:AraC-like DNA-binding protein
MKQPSKISAAEKREQFYAASFDEQSPIYVCDVGFHQTPPGHTFGPAVRPYYLLHLIESGWGEVERSGYATVRLTEGNAFLIRPGEVVTYRADEEDPWTYRWISFSGSYAQTLVSLTTDRLSMRYRKSGMRALKQVLERELPTPIELLEVLFSVLSSVQKHDGADKTPTEDDAIVGAMKYLEGNYIHAISIDALAQSFGYSRAYFSTLFSRRVGRSPYQYLTEVRIERAKDYLKNASYTVEEVAYSVGFSCIGRFCELFKKYVGCTPLQYRNQSVE